MKTAGIWFVVAVATSLVAGQNATAVLVDFNFNVSYSGSSISGRLVGLNLDGNGNGTEVDPTSVLLFNVPASVGLAASPSQPYVFVPHTFERSTYSSGTYSSTTPGVYGFQVSNYTMNPPAQNLLMRDAENDVLLVFNFGGSSGYEGGTATYGIMAEEDALWPAVNCFVSFTAVSVPGDYNRDGGVDAADYVVWRETDGTQAGYELWRAHFGATSGSGAGSGATGAARAVPEPAAAVLLLSLAVSVVFTLRVKNSARGASRRTLDSLTRSVRATLWIALASSPPSRDNDISIQASTIGRIARAPLHWAYGAPR